MEFVVYDYKKALLIEHVMIFNACTGNLPESLAFYVGLFSKVIF